MRPIIPSLAALAVLAIAAPAFSNPDDGSGRKLSAMLDGASEVPGPGDPDGGGSIEARVNAGQGQFCYTLTVTNIAPATAAHIHLGAAGSAGPVSIPLTAPTNGKSSGCVAISKDLAQALIQDPAAYYANVHNTPHPAGAVRGQLGK